jgi:hypothetical protein
MSFSLQRAMDEAVNRRVRVSLTLAVLSLAFFSGTASASAASEPSIEAVSVSHITATDATLEAQINPNGLETTYEFHLTSPACQREWPIAGPCFAIIGIPLPSATISAQSGDQTVSLDLNSAGAKLQPDTWYEYAVTASNSAGEVTGHNPGEGPGIGRNFAGGGGEQNFETLGRPPLIESVSLAHLAPTDATLEAEINTEGLETTYQFKMWASPCSHRGNGCELIMNVPLPSGKLLGSFVGQSVSLDLNSAGVTWTPGGEYGYSVTATNADGSVEGPWHQFEPPASTPWATLGSGETVPKTLPVSPDGQVPSAYQPSSTSYSSHGHMRMHHRGKHNRGQHRRSTRR